VKNKSTPKALIIHLSFKNWVPKTETQTASENWRGKRRAYSAEVGLERVT